MSQFKNNDSLISENTTDMNLNPGDVDSDRTVSLDAGDNEIEMGGAVKFDASGDIEMTEANDDDVIGVVLSESHDKGGSTKYTVNVFGYVFAAQLDDQGSTDVDPGDVLIPSADYNGAWTDADTGTAANTDDTDADLYLNHPIAIESGEGGADDGDLDGDVILAYYR